ncbi:MAG TPA: endolytic transglycosylase MltG [Spirochaetota bacterium]|nr:endolytic transglycosylase MltG [Spirochaetota bacterium]HOM38374.1 endolytic transglycosylase MltG [Spirochaetota bacterium]HPQ48408.1 endolytic transglycosylase MltG [Spirochaetota bacterium]
MKINFVKEFLIDFFRKIRPRYIFIFISILIVLIFFFVSISKILPVDKNNNEPFFLEINNGQSFNEVANILLENNIISSKFYAKILWKLKGGSLKAGYYKLTRSMSLIKVLEILKEGKEHFITFTIPEGATTYDIIALLEKKSFNYDFIKSVKDSFSDKEIIKKYNIPFDTVEGYIFPSTYYISKKNMDGKKFVDMTIKTFRDKTKDLLNGISKEGEKKIIILASIIEKEVYLENEKPFVASVFYNRLDKNIPLESCATVIYSFERLGIIKTRLLYKDLEIDSPYNSYKRRGLPPGPISNPGLSSIKAAIYPEKTDYLYFVHKGDKTHHFSKTLKEHMEAYRKYIFYQKVK